MTAAVRQPAIVAFTAPGAPTPKGRPRFGKGATYTPEKTRRAEAAIAWAARAAQVPCFDGPVAVSLVFWCASGTRGDLDNLVKLALDGLNGVAFRDDRQVVALTARVQRDRANPRTYVEIRAADGEGR